MSKRKAKRKQPDHGSTKFLAKRLIVTKAAGFGVTNRSSAKIIKRSRG